MAHIDLKEVKMHGGVPLPFAPGYTAAETPDAAGAQPATGPAPTRANPYGGFTVTLTSPPEAGRVAIDYALVQDGREVRRDTQELAFSGKTDGDGRKIWNLLSMPVPPGAEVHFKVRYEMAGESRVHDDNGRAFVATA